MSSDKIKPQTRTHIKNHKHSKTERKDDTLNDVFSDFNQRYGQADKVLKTSRNNNGGYLKRFPFSIDECNTTQFSYRRDMSEIKYNIDVFKNQKSVIESRWEPLPKSAVIDWKSLVQLEEKVKGWKQ